MLKNILIGMLLTHELYMLSPYQFGAVDAIISCLCAFAVITVAICETEITIREHISYKKRSKFRQLLGMTDLRKEGRRA